MIAIDIIVVETKIVRNFLKEDEKKKEKLIK
jgi:hypothetical protein